MINTCKGNNEKSIVEKDGIQAANECRGRVKRKKKETGFGWINDSDPWYERGAASTSSL